MIALFAARVLRPLHDDIEHAPDAAILGREHDTFAHRLGNAVRAVAHQRVDAAFHDMHIVGEADTICICCIVGRELYASSCAIAASRSLLCVTRK